MTKHREPGRPRRAWSRLVRHGENAPYYVLVDRNAEGQGDLLSDSGTTPARIPPFHVDEAATTSWLGPFGPGFVGALVENSRRYFPVVSAR